MAGSMEVESHCKCHRFLTFIVMTDAIERVDGLGCVNACMDDTDVVDDEGILWTLFVS